MANASRNLWRTRWQSGAIMSRIHNADLVDGNQKLEHDIPTELEQSRDISVSHPLAVVTSTSTAPPPANGVQPIPKPPRPHRDPHVERWLGLVAAVTAGVVVVLVASSTLINRKVAWTSGRAAVSSPRAVRHSYTDSEALFSAVDRYAERQMTAGKGAGIHARSRSRPANRAYSRARRRRSDRSPRHPADGLHSRLSHEVVHRAGDHAARGTETCRSRRASPAISALVHRA